MAIGDFVKARREELKMSRAALAKKAGISSSEMFRIESGKRKESSTKILFSIANALSVSQEEILREAGYTVPDNALERAFPGLKGKERIETVRKIADAVARNPDIPIDGLYQQLEMFVNYYSKK